MKFGVDMADGRAANLDVMSTSRQTDSFGPVPTRVKPVLAYEAKTGFRQTSAAACAPPRCRGGTYLASQHSPSTGNNQSSRALADYQTLHIAPEELAMDLSSYLALWNELHTIMEHESLEIVYEDLTSQAGPYTFLEGAYRPSTPSKIYIDSLYEGSYPNSVNPEPIIVSHEIGHYFDFRSDPNSHIPTVERERRANGFMVDICKRHGLLSDALDERKRREQNQ